MTALPPLEIRYADVITPDFNSIEEEQERCDSCQQGFWPEDAGEVPGAGTDEHYCEACAFQIKKEMSS